MLVFERYMLAGPVEASPNRRCARANFIRDSDGTVAGLNGDAKSS